MFGDLFKYISIFTQIMDLKSKVQENLRTGGSVKSLLEQAGPGALELVKQIGAQFFPEVAGEEKQVQAAAMKVWDLDYVKGVQAALNKLGQSPALAVDGDYGEKTKAAVTEYQRKHGKLVVDGWAGEKTKAALQAEAAEKAS